MTDMSQYESPQDEHKDLDFLSQPGKLDKILNEFCEKLDEKHLGCEMDLNECIRNIRTLDPDFADDLEKMFSRLQTEVRFGTILSTYIKSEFIRPMQQKLRKESQ